eukprot:10516055-Alexandrium_andersonii.AAC.1
MGREAPSSGQRQPRPPRGPGVKPQGAASLRRTGRYGGKHAPWRPTGSECRTARGRPCCSRPAD